MDNWRIWTARCTHTINEACVASRSSVAQHEAGVRVRETLPIEAVQTMKFRNLYIKIARLAICLAAGATLCGCAALHGSPNGPGDCVGPPDYCTPYFGN